MTQTGDRVDALVIFGATGDLAKLETFPALVGLVERGVLDVPVIGVAKSGWGLPQFRDYAAASLKLNGMDPASPAAAKMLGLLKYVDGDLDDDATYQAMSDAIGGQGGSVLRTPGSWWRSRSALTWPAPGSSIRPCTSSSTKTRSTASITGSAWTR
jgi:glucose-6-phosphate 1-dehydrogenase